MENSARCWELSPSLASVSADLWWGVRRALSGPGRSPRRHKTHSTSHPTPVVSHYDGGTPFVRAWLIPSEGAPVFEFVKQRQMSLSASGGRAGGRRYDVESLLRMLSFNSAWRPDKPAVHCSAEPSPSIECEMTLVWRGTRLVSRGGCGGGCWGGLALCERQLLCVLRRLSFDEGRQWSKYAFTSTPLFVDGVLGEPGEETLIMT